LYLFEYAHMKKGNILVQPACTWLQDMIPLDHLCIRHFENGSS
jgi:hypothetical protein